MKRGRPLRWLLLVASGSAFASSCDSGGQTGSETHWFSVCDRDDVCGPGLRCVCGMCTKTGCGALVRCGAKATCVLDGNDSPLRDNCGGEQPPPSVCAATCTASADCTRGLKCQSGVCVAPAPTARVADASAPGRATRDGGGADASSASPKAGPSDAAADANYDWPMDCPNEMAPLGASKLVDGPTVVMLNAPSGLYFGTPSALGTGVIVRRLTPSGGQDLPLGDRWLPLQLAGPSALFYSSSAGFQWYSPSQDRVVATWKVVGHLIPFFVGESVDAVQYLGADGGTPFRIVTLEPSPDGGEPQATPYNAGVPDLNEEPGLMVADANTLYYSIANTVYELSPSGAPRELATVAGSLFNLELSANTLFVTVWGTPGLHGGITAVDRATGQQTRLVVADEIHETRVFGDNVYYTTPEGTGSCIDLRRVPAAGGVPETLGTSAVQSFVFGASQLYAATFSGLYEVPE